MPQLADGLARLDERPADVGVLDQALPVRDAAGLRRSRWPPGVPDSGTGMTRSASTGCSAASRRPTSTRVGLHAAAGDRGVRAGEVDVLEQAALRLGGREAVRAQAVLVDRDQLARLDLADEGRADDVQRGGLAGHHPAAVEPAEHQRAEALRVARRVQRVLVHEDQRERAPHQRQRSERGGLDAAAPCRSESGHVRPAPSGEQRGEHVGVGGRPAAQRPPPARRSTCAASSRVLIRLPLWPSARLADGVARKRRLRVLPDRRAGGGVAAVPDRDVAAQGVEHGLVEDLRDQAHVLVDDDPATRR